MQPSDTLYVLDEGADQGEADDQWTPMPVASVSTLIGLCGSALLNPVLDAGRSAYRVRIAGTVAVTVREGAPTWCRAASAPRTIPRVHRRLVARLGRLELGVRHVERHTAGDGCLSAVRSFTRVLRAGHGGVGQREYATGGGRAHAVRRATGVTLRTQVSTARLGIGASTVVHMDSLQSRIAVRNRQ
ncbi:MAG: hypothetical protein U0163_12390 [Gemmatimonadaceae bacterium]